MEIHDLDILRPEAEFVVLGKKKIDISFVPSGVALDIMKLREELEGLADTPEKIKKIEAGGKEAVRSFDITAEVCSKITQNQHSEMTKEWLLKNTSVVQLKALVEHITTAVFKSLGEVDEKNVESGQAQ
jgi:hypothetical protein